MLRRIVAVRQIYKKGEHKDGGLCVGPNILAAYKSDVCMTDQEVKEFHAILAEKYKIEEKLVTDKHPFNDKFWSVVCTVVVLLITSIYVGGFVYGLIIGEE